MSTKMQVRYGIDAIAITDVPDDDFVITFIVTDENDKEIGRRSFDVQELPIGNQHRSFLYGGNKLLTDRTSDQKNKLLKLDDMQEVFDLLASGEWSKERVVGAIVCSPAVEALGRLMKPPMSIPDTQAALGQYDADTRKALLGRKDVVELAKEITEARKGRDVPTLDSMLPQS